MVKEAKNIRQQRLMNEINAEQQHEMMVELWKEMFDRKWMKVIVEEMARFSARDSNDDVEPSTLEDAENLEWTRSPKDTRRRYLQKQIQAFARTGALLPVSGEEWAEAKIREHSALRGERREQQIQ